MRAGVVTVSDGVFHGQREDASGAVLETAARAAGGDWYCRAWLSCVCSPRRYWRTRHCKDRLRRFHQGTNRSVKIHASYRAALGARTENWDVDFIDPRSFVLLELAWARLRPWLD